jgi:Flp pilus assembly protein TadG
MRVAVSAITPIKALLRALADECGGAISVEFAIAIPLFTGLVIGIVQGGLVLFDEIELVNATAVGLRTFALGRQPPCGGCTPQPYTNTINAIANSGRLPLGAANVTLSVGGATCANDATCLTALNAAYYASDVHYSPASWTSVTVTHPCPTFLPASWLALAGVCLGVNNSPPGFLSTQMSQQIQ